MLLLQERRLLHNPCESTNRYIGVLSFYCNKCELADAYGFKNLRRETIECNVKTLEFWVDGGEFVDACKNYESRIKTHQDLMEQNKQVMEKAN